MNDELELRFTTRILNDEEIEHQVALGETGKELAYLIDEHVPISREQSLALTKLEEAIFWANAGIARRS